MVSPSVKTSSAIVIFVTDLNDPQFEKKIKQANIRDFCDCSAYAFHRTRNKLGLKFKITAHRFSNAKEALMRAMSLIKNKYYNQVIDLNKIMIGNFKTTQ